MFLTMSSCEGKENFKYTLSIGAIFQNESDYMREWIEYHRMVGVEHFILYNNNSTDDYLSVLKPYVEEGLVELIEWPSVQEENDWSHFSFVIQPNAYTDAVMKSCHISKWIALIDMDEFIVPMNFNTISELLESRYPNVSGLCVNWQCFGTSGVSCLEKSYPMIGQLVMKAKWDDDEEHKYCKSIVQPLHVSVCDHPHYCKYKSGHWSVDTKFRPCEMRSPTIEINEIRINHYWTRDEWFLYNIKLARYEKWGNKIDMVKKRADKMNTEFDGVMSRFVPRLHEILSKENP